MLLSLFSSEPVPARLKIHLVQDETITGDDLHRLNKLCLSYGAEFFARRPLQELEQLLPGNGRYPVATWYRLILGSHLSELDRVIYLDSDLLVRTSLAPLWSMDLSQAVIAVAKHPLLPHVDRRRIKSLGVANLSDYFNTGVMLIDLEKYRRHEEAALAFVSTTEIELSFADQDVLNAVLGDHHTKISNLWNVQLPHFELPFWALSESSSELKKMRRSPNIVHFTGVVKPWHERCRHPYKSEFLEYLGQTEWSDIRSGNLSLKEYLIRFLPSWFIPLFTKALPREMIHLFKLTFRRHP